MALAGEYEPSPQEWVREQVEAYESSAGARGNTLRDTGMPVVIVTSVGARSGKIRKTPLMRVEHGGRYALLASQGGAPRHPTWYLNLLRNPQIELQDGPAPPEHDRQAPRRRREGRVVEACRGGVPQLRDL